MDNLERIKKVEEIDDLLDDVKDLDTCNELALSYVLSNIFFHFPREHGLKYFIKIMNDSLCSLINQYEEKKEDEPQGNA